jgi:hypothetical protein
VGAAQISADTPPTFPDRRIPTEVALNVLPGAKS